MGLWDYYVKDIRTKYFNNDQKKEEDLNKERRSLMILTKLEKDHSLLSHLKGDENHPNDKMIILDVNIKCIILTFSRKVNNDLEVNANLRFNRDIYNNKLKEKI